jgi:Na+/H+-dicarboxylate symporter
MSLATKVLIGFALGDAFIRLLQMTVLPYIVASLILGLGRLNYREAGQLVRRAGVLLLVIWSVGGYGDLFKGIGSNGKIPKREEHLWTE